MTPAVIVTSNGFFSVTSSSFSVTLSSFAVGDYVVLFVGDFDGLFVGDFDWLFVGDFDGLFVGDLTSSSFSVIASNRIRLWLGLGLGCD